MKRKTILQALQQALPYDIYCVWERHKDNLKVALYRLDDTIEEGENVLKMFINLNKAHETQEGVNFWTLVSDGNFDEARKHLVIDFRLVGTTPKRMPYHCNGHDRLVTISIYDIEKLVESAVQGAMSMQKKIKELSE
jgi:hypothetical protein